MQPLLADRDDEFTMLVMIAYTGMRWGETIGLERDQQSRCSSQAREGEAENTISQIAPNTATAPILRIG